MPLSKTKKYRSQTILKLLLERGPMTSKQIVALILDSITRVSGRREYFAAISIASNTLRRTDDADEQAELGARRIIQTSICSLQSRGVIVKVAGDHKSRANPTVWDLSPEQKKAMRIEILMSDVSFITTKGKA